MSIWESPFTFLEYGVYFSYVELLCILCLVFDLGYFLGQQRTFRYFKDKIKTDQTFFMLPLESSENTSKLIQEPELEQSIQKESTQIVSPKVFKKSFKDETCDQNSNTRTDSWDKSSKLKSPDELSKELLSEKISIEGQKLQSRGTFHMTFEKAQNPNFIRKIQKHEIITDYEVSAVKSESNQIIPFGSKKFLEIKDQKSILEISSYQNSRLASSPIVSNKIIRTNLLRDLNSDFNFAMSSSLCENGKFHKFFRSPRKIGEGAFGVVYSVHSIFENKEYAIKKLFFKGNASTERIEKIVRNSMKEVAIVSQYSHPNIIRFHTCWLEIANLQESMHFNKISFRERQESVEIINDSNFISSSLRKSNFRKKKVAEEFVEVSYIPSSNENSNFCFAEQSLSLPKGQKLARNSIKKSISKDRSVQTCQVYTNGSQANGESRIQSRKYFKEEVHSCESMPIFALYIQMELCQEGSLDQYLLRRTKIDRRLNFVILDQLLKGVQYLHSNGLVHRDLKPANIMISLKERQIKIGDFGLSAKMTEDIQIGRIGTPSYIAPELLEKRALSKEELHLTDVYSIGVIYFELMNLFNKVTRHERTQKTNNLRINRVELAKEFKLEKKVIKLMTAKKRPNCLEILSSAEFKALKEAVFSENPDQDCWRSFTFDTDVKNIEMQE